VTRHMFPAMACLLMLAGSAQAQDWARKMFEETTYDFGSVARGAKAVHAFTLKNIYEETVHVTGVRSTCGCTTVEIKHPTVKTFETAEIVANFNTVAFRGPHSATLSVMIDQPFPAEVQLQVYGDVRTDVVIDPGLISFGSVNQGTPVSRKLTIRYAGRDDWKIVDVRSANPSFEVNPLQRSAGRVAYELNVHLKEIAPAGYLNDQLVLVTNDTHTTKIPIQVEGRVVPEISVSPHSLVLGEVHSGNEISKNLVVRSNSKKPFKIVDIRCDDDSFTFKADGKAKPLHLVAIAFHAPAKAGDVRKTIHIQTDRGGSDVTLVAYAKVVP
jgi:hypothetical protein